VVSVKLFSIFRLVNTLASARMYLYLTQFKMKANRRKLIKDM